MVASPSAPQEALLVDGPSAPQEALRRAVAETLRNADFLVSLGVLVLTVHLWKLRVQLQRARSRGPPWQRRLELLGPFLVALAHALYASVWESSPALRDVTLVHLLGRLGGELAAGELWQPAACALSAAPFVLLSLALRLAATAPVLCANACGLGAAALLMAAALLNALLNEHEFDDAQLHVLLALAPIKLLLTLPELLTGLDLYQHFSVRGHQFVLLSLASTLLVAVCGCGAVSELVSDAPEVRYSTHMGGALLLGGALLVHVAVRADAGRRIVIAAAGGLEGWGAGGWRKLLQKRKEDAVPTDPWTCPVCTLLNDRKAMTCNACAAPRPAAASAAGGGGAVPKKKKKEKSAAAAGGGAMIADVVPVLLPRAHAAGLVLSAQLGCWLASLGCCFIVLGLLRSVALQTILPGGQLLTLPAALTQCFRFSLTLSALGAATLKWSFVLNDHAFDLKGGWHTVEWLVCFAAGSFMLVFGVLSLILRTALFLSFSWKFWASVLVLAAVLFSQSDSTAGHGKKSKAKNA
jgi:hypothetical protein